MLSGEMARRERRDAMPPEIHLGVEGGVGRSILSAIGDAFSLKILESAIKHGRSVEEISAKESIPMSTSYRRVNELKEAGLLILEKVIVTRSGKKHMIYRSTFSRFRVELGPLTSTIVCTPNGGIPDISYRIWKLARCDSDGEATPTDRGTERCVSSPTTPSSRWV